MIQEAMELFTVGSWWRLQCRTEGERGYSKVYQRRVEVVLEDRVVFHSSWTDDDYRDEPGVLVHFELTRSIERRWEVKGKVITITDHLRKVTQEAVKLDDTPIQTFKYTRQRK